MRRRHKSKPRKIRKFVIPAVAALIIIAVIIIIHDRRTIFEIAPPPKAPDWNSGPIVHLLPTVNHNRILMKVSFEKPFAEPPRLKIGDDYFVGQQTDTKGYFWAFDATGLKPKTTYELVIQDSAGNNLCDAWPLSTFPSPEDRPEHFRLLIYTCAGGHDAHITWRGTGPIPLAARTRLLKKALSLQPDAVISSGDQIYYDLVYGRTPKYMGRSPESVAYAGTFDRSIPVLGTKNEEVLKKAVGPQIANLYGTLFHSIPTFFMLDDHDYFENDEARPEDTFNWVDLLIGWRNPIIKAGVSFPPDDFMLDLGRSSQKLYLPEFLPDATWPADLPAVGAPDRAPGVSECYGTLRYGTLVEILLFECRRFITLAGPHSVLVHPAAERWLINRMQAEETTHIMNASATIFGWSAGKWMEWYPDIREEDKLTTARPKYMWQEGWFTQHNRLLKAASSMKKTIPLFVCGDIHDISAGRILRSGELDLSANPVIAIASGSLGTGPRGFPSGAVRKMVAQPPTDLTVEEWLAPVEKDGFMIADFMPDKIVIQFYAWRPPEPLEAIDTLEPFHSLELKIPPQ